MSAVTHESISAFMKDATLIPSPQGREDLKNYTYKGYSGQRHLNHAPWSKHGVATTNNFPYC